MSIFLVPRNKQEERLKKHKPFTFVVEDGAPHTALNLVYQHDDENEVLETGPSLSSALGQETISGFSFTHAYVWFQDADLSA